LATRNSFFGAVDKWQAGFILSENAKSSEPAYGSNSQSNDLVSLPSSILQLFLAEPSLLDIPELSAFLDSTTSASASRPPQSHITTHGLTPILIRLLSSPDNARRNWALAQLPAAAWRPLSFQEWRDNGIGDELRRLYEGDLEVEPEARWEAIKAILKSNSLSREAVQDGLLGAASRRDQSQRSDWGVMVTLSGLLGSETDCELII
jgi:senataxin